MTGFLRVWITVVCMLVSYWLAFFIGMNLQIVTPHGYEWTYDGVHHVLKLGGEIK